MRSPDFLTAVGIGVSDLARSADFYRRVLGMAETGRFSPPEMDEIMLAHEGRPAVVLMHWTDGSKPKCADNPVKLVFYVTDPVRFAEAVRAEGLEVTREAAPLESMGGALIALAKDPDGYVLEFIESPAALAERRAREAAPTAA
ncbi:MAG TPA: VOC family protein [Caulobacteraceae bacterium]|nr:VOC family protein [Caulobacteraceae bacterium]